MINNVCALLFFKTTAILEYTAVSRKVVLQMGKACATMSKVIMGNGGF